MYQRCLSMLLCGALSILAGCSEDGNAPRVISMVPTPDSTDAPRRTILRVQFNEAIRASSIPTDPYVLEYNGEALAGADLFLPELNTVSFVPHELLFFLRKYDVRFSGEISDQDGNRSNTQAEWSFRVTDGVLRSDILIGNRSSGDATEPQVAIGSNDHRHVIWTQTDGTRTDIWARAIRGDALKAALRVENANAGDARSPQIVVDEDGNAIAVWSYFDGTNWRIQANRFTPPTEAEEEAADAADEVAQGTWGTATIISGDGSDATAPQIAIGPNGNAIAVWVQSDDRVYANRFTGGAWGAAVAIDADTGEPEAPQIVIDGSNNAFVVWAQNDRIYENRYTGGWGTAATIDDDSGTATEPQIAADGDGNAIAVWSQSDATVTNIWSAYFNGNAWETAEKIETTGGSAETPQVAMNQSGNAIAVWSHKASSPRVRIRGNHFTPGRGWASGTDLIDNFSPDVYTANITDKGISTEPQVAIDDDGNALVVWSVEDGTSKKLSHIAGNRYRGPGAPEDMRGWDSAVLIESDDDYHSGDATSPQVAIAPDFTGITVWSKLNVDDRAIVHANHFN